MHCESACSAIHWLRRAKCSNGADAGFREAHSNGCDLSERERHKRLQKRTGHGVEDVEAAHGTIKGDVVRGVEQYPHACEDICMSYRFLGGPSGIRHRSYRARTHHSGASANGSSFQIVSLSARGPVATRPLPLSLLKYFTSAFFVHFEMSRPSIIFEVG